MAKVTKTQVWNDVQSDVLELIEGSKVSKKFSEDLLKLLADHIAPKSGGGTSQNPPKEIDGIMNYYCRFHQEYYPEDKMVMSGGKSKGYCKAAISKWNKTNSAIKKLDSEAVEFMSKGEFDKAQEIARKSQDLKDNLNKPEFYNKDEDWAIFNGTSKTAQEPTKDE